MVDDFLQPAAGSEPFKAAGDTISIVGSSGKLLFHPKAQEIDSADDVCRFNSAPIKGFESCVGSKTTMRILNVNLVYAYFSRNYALGLKERFPDFQINYLRELRDTKLIFCFSESYLNKSGVQFHPLRKRLLRNGNSIYFLTEDAEAHLSESFQKSPSCGLIGTILGLSYHKTINCFGFSVGIDEYPRYYYRDPNQYRQGGHHDFDQETLVRSRLAQDGLINLI